jgi:membrane-bound ClpP family serine protease
MKQTCTKKVLLPYYVKECYNVTISKKRGGLMDVFEFLTSIEWLPAILFIIGFVLAIIEMFNPGFGVPGITGVVCLIAGVVLMANTPVEALILIFIIIVILGTALAIVFHLASKGKISRRIILSDKLNKESGFNGTEDMGRYIGLEGTATSVLRPSGTADFDGMKLDVVSQGEYIAKGADIRVVKVEGRRIVVDDFEKN